MDSSLPKELPGVGKCPKCLMDISYSMLRSCVTFWQLRLKPNMFIWMYIRTWKTGDNWQLWVLIKSPAPLPLPLHGSFVQIHVLFLGQVPPSYSKVNTHFYMRDSYRTCWWVSFWHFFSLHALLIRLCTKHTIDARLLANLTRAHDHLPYEYWFLFIIIRHGVLIQGEGSRARQVVT